MYRINTPDTYDDHCNRGYPDIFSSVELMLLGLLICILYSDNTFVIFSLNIYDFFFDVTYILILTKQS